MAFCRQCGAQPSGGDRFCGQCGTQILREEPAGATAPDAEAPKQEPEADSSIRSIYIAFVGLALIVFVPFLIFSRPGFFYDPLPGSAKEAVRSTLHDPDSAQFRDVERCPGKQDMIRGEFNGKNLMGAYVGFKPFYYAEHQGVTTLDGAFSVATQKCFHGDAR